VFFLLVVMVRKERDYRSCRMVQQFATRACHALIGELLLTMLFFFSTFLVLSCAHACSFSSYLLDPFYILTTAVFFILSAACLFVSLALKRFSLVP
jgi:hypothetical protein